jgi:hypothetical protein
MVLEGPRSRERWLVEIGVVIAGGGASRASSLPGPQLVAAILSKMHVACNHSRVLHARHNRYLQP